MLEKRKLKNKKEELKEKNEIEIQIIAKLNKEISDKKNELEIIDTQVYILSKIEDDEYNKEKIAEEQKEIEEIFKKIETIEEQIKIYAEDKVIEDNLLLDNKDIIDQISDYKKMASNYISFKKEYSKIEDYLIILKQIEQINDKCMELDKNKKDNLLKINISETEINNAENKLILEDESLKKITEEMQNCSKVINTLEEKVENIESTNKIIYNYDKLNKLISLELKYIFLKSISPLKGSIPQIAISTKITKEAINILLRDKLVETENKIEYFADDYQEIIEKSYYSLEEIENNINDSLTNINMIKEKLDNKIIKNNPKALEILTKIEQIEEVTKKNANIIEIYKNKINNYKEKNRKKLEKVKELNR